MLLSEINQSQTTNTVWLHLNDISKVVRLVDAESRMMMARAEGREN